MKMGPIASPQHYDAGTLHPLQPERLRRPFDFEPGVVGWPYSDLESVGLPLVPSLGCNDFQGSNLPSFGRAKGVDEHLQIVLASQHVGTHGGH